MKQNKFYYIFIIIFFSIFIASGIGLLSFGFVKLARYNFAEQIPATVISAEYKNNEVDVTFSFNRNGEDIQKSVHFNKVEYKNGALPYFEGKEVILRIDNFNQIVQFERKDTILIVGGAIFFIAGTLFLYFCVLRKNNLIDIAFEYEKSMVSPDSIADHTAKYEAMDDELSKLSKNSTKRICGMMTVWNNRILDRFKSFSVYENIFYFSCLILPMIFLCLLPLFFNRQVTTGYIFSSIFAWFFIYCFAGTLLKYFHNLYIRLLVKKGKFSEKKNAIVKQCAFESSAYFQNGDLSRTHTIFKKFRVVALIDGKRSIGYVKGNIPPPKGVTLKVLIRPGHPRKWIIDNT